MANWYRNPQRPDEAVNLDLLAVVYVEEDVTNDDSLGWCVHGRTVGDTGGYTPLVTVAGPYDNHGEALAVLTGIVGAVD